MDEGQGWVKTLIHKIWINSCFLTLPLEKSCEWTVVSDLAILNQKWSKIDAQNISFLSSQTILLSIGRELAGGGCMAVAVGVSDM